MEKITTSNNPFLQHVLFWIGVLLYFMASSSAAAQLSYWTVLEIYAPIVFLQIIAAYTCLNFLIPIFLDKGKNLTFIILLFILSLFLFALYITIIF